MLFMFLVFVVINTLMVVQEDNTTNKYLSLSPITTKAVVKTLL